MAYRGITVSIPVGRQGFSGSRNPTQQGPGHLIDMDNLSLAGGVLQKEGGAEIFSGSPFDASVVAGIHWVPEPGSAFDYTFRTDGVIQRIDSAGTRTNVTLGLNVDETPPGVFVPGGGEGVGDARHLFFFSASNQVRQITGTGTTSTAITGPAADWTGAGNFPTFGVLHVGRMWAGGNASDPHRAYVSSTTDHEDYSTTPLTFSIFPGEGEALVGGVSFRGAIILFKKPTGVYIIDTRDPSPSNWRVDRLSDATGAINQQTIVQIENDVLYMDTSGNIHMLSATDAFGDVNTANLNLISDFQEFMRTNVNRSQIERSVGAWYPDKRHALFGVPATTMTTNSIRIAVDFSDREIGPRFILNFRDVQMSMWMHPNSDGVQRPMIGDDNNQIWQLDQEQRDKDGAGYELIFETSNSDLAFANPEFGPRAKSGQFLEVVAEPRGDWNLTVDIFWDDILTDTLQFNMGAGGAALGSFVLDTDELGSTVVFSNRQRLIGSGRRVRFRGTNDGADQNIVIADFLLSFALQDERIRE